MNLFMQKMENNLRCFIGMTLILLALSVGACGERIAPSLPFDRSLAGSVKTIGMLTPRFPEKGPAVYILTSGFNAGVLLGLTGVMIDGAIQHSRESRFKTILAQKNFSFQEEFIKNVQATLRARGYFVKDVPMRRESAGFVRPPPPEEDQKIDAYLDLDIRTYGYVAVGATSSYPYRPFLEVHVRLARRSDGAELMRDIIVYNPSYISSLPWDIVTLSPDPVYQFADFSQMMANPIAVVEGLKGAIQQSAEALTKLLGR